MVLRKFTYSEIYLFLTTCVNKFYDINSHGFTQKESVFRVFFLLVSRAFYVDYLPSC